MSSECEKPGSGSTLSGGTREEPPLLLLGGLQMLLGVLMAVCGVLAVVQEAALAGVGAGLWGGAVGMAAGVVGVLAGLRGCYTPPPPPLAATAFLALCLVALAVGNLVVVLSVIGIVRDARSSEAVSWPPLLANCGQLLVSAAHCVVSVVAGFRCARRLCPCRPRPRPESPEPSFHSTAGSSKELLVSNWLGQHILTPIQGPCGPIFTLPSPPPIAPSSVIGYHLPNAPFLNPLVPPQYIVTRSTGSLSSHAEGARRLRDRDASRRKRRSTRKRKRSTSSTPAIPQRPVTEEEVARTYTGLDREIAEEFIAIAMEPGTGRHKTLVADADIPTEHSSGDAILYGEKL